MKLRISLTQDKADIKGTIELARDPAFVLEALALIVETVAQRSEVSVKEVLEDVWIAHLKGMQK